MLRNLLVRIYREKDIQAINNSIEAKVKEKVLVTGGSGFIGSNLVEVLLDHGYNVRILDNFSSGSRDNISEFNHIPEFEIMEGDIRDLHCCLQAIKDVDSVIHLAALGSVPRSISEPINSNENNVSGTLNMLVAARDSKIRRFVCASSSSVYGNSSQFGAQPVQKKETDFPAPVSPYAITKYALELYARQFYHLYGLPTIALRFFNVFGKKQNPFSQYAAVIPIFIHQLLRGESPTIFGDGSTSRDFTHVDNVTKACVQCLTAPREAFGQVFNVACGDSITLSQLYDAIRTELGSNIKPQYASERQGDIKFSMADIQKARDILAYNPELSFEQGIKKTVRWYVHQTQIQNTFRRNVTS
ncbi:MAG TPA: NAD-dependent epimerase/dehydratase family protein [Saprospiraceae bacterium]|nr:NAD-dependent epimerase/dehydratase family protein [Saprospiraceae bacterium]